MRVQDRAFQRLFSKLFVYNILFEDAEVDEKYLGIENDSRVLSISGAGCGVAGMLAKQPTSVDAVDINPHHLAMTALKVTASRHLTPYVDFYDLLARGWAPNPKLVMKNLAQYMPRWARGYWLKHHRRFESSMVQEGLTAKMLKSLRSMTGLNADWVRTHMHEPVAVRLRAVDEWISPALNRPLIRHLMESPVQLLSLGINFSQRDRLLATEGTDIIDYFITHIKRVAATEVETNWFAWYVAAGQFNHDHPDAVPPYLRRDRWEAAQSSRTRVNYHNRNIFDVLGSAENETWSHYTLCDAPDWMPEPVQRRLLDEILRTSRDGAIVMSRTVEDDCMVDRLNYDNRFKRLDFSDVASEEERSRQYRYVHFYQVQH